MGDDGIWSCWNGIRREVHRPSFSKWSVTNVHCITPYVLLLFKIFNNWCWKSSHWGKKESQIICIKELPSKKHPIVFAGKILQEREENFLWVLYSIEEFKNVYPIKQHKFKTIKYQNNIKKRYWTTKAFRGIKLHLYELKK